MNNTLYILFISLITVSCGQGNDSKTEKEKIILETPDKIQERERKEIQEKNKLYDKHCLSALLAGIDSAKNNLNKDVFYNEFDFTDSLTSSKVKLSMGKLFYKNQKHLIIKRGVADTYYGNIYKIENNQIIPVLKHIQEGHSFIKDTIFDVNGDGILDFSVHSYSSSGCCRRNVYTVFLNKKNGEFIPEAHFMNPTFSPKEKIIRGVDYGYESGLYKYKWNNFKLDSLEFIIENFLDSNNLSYFISKTKHGLYDSTKRKTIQKIPEEYLNINDLDWFLYN